MHPKCFQAVAPGHCLAPTPIESTTICIASYYSNVTKYIIYSNGC